MAQSAKLMLFDPAVDPDDIFLWPDAFWCFREEYSTTMLRDAGYRVILRHSSEWLSY